MSVPQGGGLKGEHAPWERPRGRRQGGCSEQLGGGGGSHSKVTHRWSDPRQEVCKHWRGGETKEGHVDRRQTTKDRFLGLTHLEFWGGRGQTKVQGTGRGGLERDSLYLEDTYRQVDPYFSNDNVQANAPGVREKAGSSPSRYSLSALPTKTGLGLGEEAAGLCSSPWLPRQEKVSL